MSIILINVKLTLKKREKKRKVVQKLGRTLNTH